MKPGNPATGPRSGRVGPDGVLTAGPGGGEYVFLMPTPVVGYRREPQLCVSLRVPRLVDSTKDSILLWLSGRVPSRSRALKLRPVRCSGCEMGK